MPTFWVRTVDDSDNNEDVYNSETYFIYTYKSVDLTTGAVEYYDTILCNSQEYLDEYWDGFSEAET